VLTVAAYILNVRLVLHLENPLIAHDKNIAAAVGFQCNARVISIHGDNLPVAIPSLRS
jgi:hypothetical protein